MKELIEEHVYARKTTRNLEGAKQRFVNGNPEAIKDVRKFLEYLAEFYPKHIEKEDKKNSSIPLWSILHRKNRKQCCKNAGNSTES
jgi:hemerythrin-like domain-containing protein